MVETIVLTTVVNLDSLRAIMKDYEIVQRLV